MNAHEHITVELVDWAEKGKELFSVRQAVFIEEQHVPAEMESDGRDGHCRHVLACDQDGRPIGTGRLSEDGKISRMAVLADYRKMGVGNRILETLIQLGTEIGIGEFYLTAQIRAVGFYARYGFVQDGEPFQEVGITHVMMRKPV